MEAEGLQGTMKPRLQPDMTSKMQCSCIQWTSGIMALAGTPFEFVLNNSDL